MTDLKKKILWQCRRGLWELDQILLPFVENDFEHLNKEDQLLFQKLLQYEDIELFDIFVNKIDPIDNGFRDLTVLIIDKHMKTKMDFKPSLLADLGATNARFAITEDGLSYHNPKELKISEYNSMSDLCMGYLSSIKTTNIRRAL